MIMESFRKGIADKVDSPSQKAIDKFIETFNKGRKTTFNTGLDIIPMLTDSEFKIARSQAKKDGYELERYDDNYQTVTYTLSKL